MDDLLADAGVGCEFVDGDEASFLFTVVLAYEAKQFAGGLIGEACHVGNILRIDDDAVGNWIHKCVLADE